LSKKYQESFDLSLLNTTPLHESLIRALDHFTKTPEKERLLPCVSVCLHGPPGTGKTALARHLANELERPLFVKRASDLLSKFVGGTEANLSEAFSEASEENGIMLIDEVDTFLLDRSGASRSWEVTQVNEFLTQLEQFREIFFATTNRLESLDEAVLRRFTFKLKFNYLSQEQREIAFHCHFDALLKSSGKNEAKLESFLSGLQHLTPGDFEVVRRKFQFQIEAPTQFSLLEELEAEMRLKPVCGKRKVGF
jgi:SpoVK/Ycf46/Vps4 family AAA+-type ATPase